MDNSPDIIKFLKMFGAQSLIVPFKDRNKKDTDIPVSPRTLKPENVLSAFGAMNLEGDFGLFFLVNESDNPSKRTLKNIVRCRAIWIEDDITGKKREASSFPVPPNIIVNSSPGKFHYYWLTDTTDTDEHQRVMQTLVNDWGCDPNARDISRIMRIPGTYHLKGKPFLVTAEYLIKAPYKWGTLLDAFPPTEVKKASHSVKENGESGFDISVVMNALISGENYHGSLVSLALYYANQGMNEFQITKLLLSFQPLCKDQEKAAERFSPNHLKECIGTALNKIMSETVIELLPDVEVVRNFNIKSKKVSVDVLMPPDTVFGAMVKCAYESGYRRNIMSAFLGAAATVAYLAGGKYILEGEKLKPSIQQIGLGASGVGKDPIVGAPAEFIDAVFLGNLPFEELYLVLTSNMSRVIGSRQGIENALRDSNKHDFMLCIDEIGDFIGTAISSKHANSSTEMMTFLLEIYSSGATWSGRKLAGSKGKGNEFAHKVLYSPTVTMTGASTPEKFADKMGGAYVSHGSAARIVIQNIDLYSEGADLERRPVAINRKNVPQKVHDSLMKIADQSILIPTSTKPSAIPVKLPNARATHAVVVGMDEAIYKLFFDFGEWAHKKEKKSNIGPIWNRAAINAKMYAMLFAITENPNNPVILPWMAENAIKIISASLSYQTELFDDSLMANSLHGKLRGGILSSLARNHPRALSVTQLINSTSTIKDVSPNDRKQAFQALLDENLIEERKFIAPNAKRPTTVYALVAAPEGKKD
jgi:hypothetical protein